MTEQEFENLPEGTELFASRIFIPYEKPELGPHRAVKTGYGIAVRGESWCFHYLDLYLSLTDCYGRLIKDLQEEKCRISTKIRTLTECRNQSILTKTL